MKNGTLKTFLTIAFVLCAAMAWASSTGPGVTPDEALTKLKDGNTRFVQGKCAYPNQGADRRAETFKGGQHPYAVVLTCADSRVPPEVLFDQGIGDIFTIRVAGNVMATDEIGTAEYGVEHLAVPLLLVMGHTKCGAVTAVVAGDHVGGSIPKLVAPIAPAVRTAVKNNPNLDKAALVDKAIEENVWQAIADAVKGSPDIKRLAASGKLKIVGAVYHIDSGEVVWLGEHPAKARLLSN